MSFLSYTEVSISVRCVTWSSTLAKTCKSTSWARSMPHSIWEFRTSIIARSLGITDAESVTRGMVCYQHSCAIWKPKVTSINVNIADNCLCSQRLGATTFRMRIQKWQTFVKSAVQRQPRPKHYGHTSRSIVSCTSAPNVTGGFYRRNSLWRTWKSTPRLHLVHGRAAIDVLVQRYTKYRWHFIM